MRHLSKNIWLMLLLAFTLLIFSSCKKQYSYHITGTVVKATTQEPLEGVQIEVFHDECQGYGLGGGGCTHVESHYATTNAKGEFEMAFTSEKSRKGIIFNKKYLGVYYSGLEGPYIDSGTSILNEVSMVAQTEEFEIEFEPSLPNIQEVTVGLEWDRFSGGSLQSAVVGPYPSNFGISNDINSQYKYVSLGYGEQWLKMDFDILLEDGSRLQKIDSIWLPGRYYDINDFDFDDPRRHPVYKFRY